MGIWTDPGLEPPRSYCQSFWEGGNLRNVANSIGSNLLNIPDSDPSKWSWKDEMTNSKIMTILNNDLSLIAFC